MIKNIILFACTGSAVLSGADDAFIRGVDISMLERMERSGLVYKENGAPKDAVKIFIDNGWRWFRIRLFVNPETTGGAIQDLPYALRFAQRVRDAGGRLLLDLHYSDTWADPAKQYTPAAWANLSYDELTAQVYSYTVSVINEFKKQHTLPDMVQAGNEITYGMLWPAGKNDTPEGEQRFTGLLKAGIKGIADAAGDERPPVMLHIDRGGNAAGVERFFDSMRRNDVSFDVIGLSYYPWWHGSSTAFQKALAKASGYGKPIVVVETAYPYRPPDHWPGMKQTPKLEYDLSPEGQRDFIRSVIDNVKRTPDGLGKGIFIWAAEEYRTHWFGGVNAFFDRDGNALPVIEAGHWNGK